MENNHVGWFEIPVVDMDRARTFYEAVFQIKLDPHSMGPMEMAWFPMKEDKYGSAGTLMKHELYKPSADGVVIYFTTPSGDLDADCAAIEKAGGKVVQPKKDIGEHGFIAVFLDTEGNRVALHCRK